MSSSVDLSSLSFLHGLLLFLSLFLEYMCVKKIFCLPPSSSPLSVSYTGCSLSLSLPLSLSLSLSLSFSLSLSPSLSIYISLSHSLSCFSLCIKCVKKRISVSLRRPLLFQFLTRFPSFGFLHYTMPQTKSHFSRTYK